MFGVLRPSTPERERLANSPVTSAPPPHSLAPMPSTVFSSREELLEGCKDWSATQGFAIVIARSRFNRLWLKCDRGGTYENRRNLLPDQRKRKRGESRLLGCPFKMIAAGKKDGSWVVNTEVGTHNHEPSDDLSAHPTLRRMTDQQLQKVHEMCDVSRSPAETLEELRSQWPDIKVLTRDIYNARKKYKTQKEEADNSNGVPQQQTYQDPNELGFPGPNPNGKWAWVPDGEEVTNRKSKKKRKSAPTAQALAHSALDPQLQVSNASPVVNQTTPARNGLGNGYVHPPDPATQLHNATPQDYGRFDPAANNLQFVHSPNGPGNHSAYNSHSNKQFTPLSPYSSTLNHAQQSDLTSVSRRSHPRATPATMIPPAAAPAVSGQSVSKAHTPKEQVLMSRIEQMEKEQRDQKNMLKKILGAVQSFGGSPGSETRVE